MSYERRAIDLTFSLGKGSFGEADFDIVKVPGLRVRAAITKVGGLSLGAASLQIYGLTSDIMNKLSTLGTIVFLERRNSILIEAGTVSETGVKNMSVVFRGDIQNGFVDYNSAPSVSFNVLAYTGTLQAAKPATPSSFPGVVNAVDILSSMAKVAGYNFENSGVGVVNLVNRYYAGTIIAQMQQAAKEANISMVIDDNTLAIWPLGGSRDGEPPEISPDTGLVSYPSFSSQGIEIRTLYAPGLHFAKKFKIVNSSQKPANKTWVVTKLSLDLAAEDPSGGPWFCDVEGMPPGFIGPPR